MDILSNQCEHFNQVKPFEKIMIFCNVHHIILISEPIVFKQSTKELGVGHYFVTTLATNFW
jgi:hypothetical protein